jgi:biopolymer transport protein ExbD
MARRKRAEVPEEDEPALDISSLIDVTFLLLIYFIVTTTLQKKETDLNMNLPGKAPEDTKLDIAPMFIKLNNAGEVYVGTGAAEQLMDANINERDLPNLKSQLRLYKDASMATNSKPLVQVYVEDEARQQRVIDVLNALAATEIKSITFTDLVK